MSRQRWIILCCLVFFGGPVFGGLQIGADFDGTSINQSGFFPPDTMGAVGSSHVVEFINGRYVVYNKTGTQLTASSLNTFWSNAGVSPTRFAFDPRVLYDASTDRFFSVAVDNAGNNNRFLVAVSNSGSPLSGWKAYAFNSDPGAARWADFPTLGINQDGLFISANMFAISSGSIRTSLLVVPKADLIGGITSNVTYFNNIDPNTTGFTIQPVVDLDNTANPHTLISSYNKPAGFLKTSTVTGSISSPTLNTSDGFISTNSAGSPPDADQLGSTAKVDTGDTRFSGNAIVRNGEIWSVHTINRNGRAALQWYRIDQSTNAILETGFIEDPALAYYYPSIAVDNGGNIVIGFSGSSSSQYISTYAVHGRLQSGVTTFDSVQLIHGGVGSYSRFDGIGRNRWGDYSSTVYDATSDSFWTFQLYANTGNRWQLSRDGYFYEVK